MTIAVIVKGWPRLSETFIAQEILGLERRGLRQLIVSLRQPTDKAVHELNRRVTAPVTYLPEYLHDAPARLLRALAAARRRPGWAAARAAWL
ncbi:colanic acid biosynthesis glycosyltransferase WcaL, partial [Azospirillum argentinense]